MVVVNLGDLGKYLTRQQPRRGQNFRKPRGYKGEDEDEDEDSEKENSEDEDEEGKEVVEDSEEEKEDSE